MGTCVFQSNAPHQMIVQNDRLALCLYTVTGWGVMSCGFSVPFMFGSTMFKVPTSRHCCDMTSVVKATTTLYIHIIYDIIIPALFEEKAGIMLYRSPSVRPSVRLSVRPSVRPFTFRSASISS